MISNVLIMTRNDLHYHTRNLPIEEVHQEDFIFENVGHHRLEHTSDLILFVDHLEGNGRVKVLKNRRLTVTNSNQMSTVPTNLILPSDLLDDLLCGVLDLSSPRVVLAMMGEALR